MENINTKSTPETPNVILNADENILSIKGQSYPENSVAFYRPIFSWVTEYLENSNQEVTLDLGIVYLNTSSTKSIIDLIAILNDAFNNGKKVKINWYYHPQNEAILEIGEEFKEDQDLPFELIESEE